MVLAPRSPFLVLAGQWLLVNLEMQGDGNTVQIAVWRLE
jgi:hypothetical protein